MSVLMITASWCGPCKQIKPLARKLSMETGIPLREIDVDNDPNDEASMYGAESLPTFVFLDMNGLERKDLRIVGANSERLKMGFARLAVRR